VTISHIKEESKLKTKLWLTPLLSLAMSAVFEVQTAAAQAVCHPQDGGATEVCCSSAGCWYCTTIGGRRHCGELSVVPPRILVDQLVMPTQLNITTLRVYPSASIPLRTLLPLYSLRLQ
jgi:hypothetical protein